MRKPQKRFEEQLKRQLKEKIRELGFKYNLGKISANTFFCRMDDFVKKNPSFLELIFSMVKHEYKSGVNIIVSGEFGKIFYNHLKYLFKKNQNFKLIRSYGSIRLGNSKVSLKKYKQEFKAKKTIFIDDSYCSGNTLRTIKNEVKKQGGRIDKSYIIYFNPKTGSKFKRPRKMFIFFDFFKDFKDYYKELQEKYPTKKLVNSP